MRVSPVIFGISSACLVTVFAVVAEMDKPPPQPFSSPELKACPQYVTPGHYPYKNRFLIDAVKRAPTTLIGDTGHHRPILLSYLGEEHIIRGWAENGVTNIDLEVNPRMHDVLAPHLSPVFDRDAVKREFVAYMKDRGLYSLDEWVERRSEYFTSVMEYAGKYGIHVGFISIDEKELTEQAEMLDLYKQRSRALTADCPGQTTHMQNFHDKLEQQGRQKARDFYHYSKRLVQIRVNDEDRIARMKENHKGGRRVVIFGNSHFCKGLQNVKMLLGKEAVIHIGIVTNRTIYHPDRTCDKGQEHDYIYNIETDSLDDMQNRPELETLAAATP